MRSDTLLKRDRASYWTRTPVAFSVLHGTIETKRSTPPSIKHEHFGVKIKLCCLLLERTQKHDATTWSPCKHLHGICRATCRNIDLLFGFIARQAHIRGFETFLRHTQKSLMGNEDTLWHAVSRYPYCRIRHTVCKAMMSKIGCHYHDCCRKVKLKKKRRGLSMGPPELQCQVTGQKQI